VVFLATDVLGLQPGKFQIDIVYSQCYKMRFVKAKTQMAKKKQRAPSIVEARVYRGLKTAIMAGGQHRCGGPGRAVQADYRETRT